MKFIKRLIISLVVLVVLIVGLALVAPMIFKDQIVENVKKSINSSVNATVDFADINVSFLRSFPAINLTIDGYSIVGKDAFAGYPLATGTQASVDLNFWSVINGSKTGNYEIKAIDLLDPDVKILVLDANTANYDITLPSTAETSESEASASSNMLFQLQRYSIENGHFTYDDRVAETYVEASNFQHSGSGDFTLDEFELDTDTQFDALTLKQGGVAYLNKTAGSLDAIFNIDLANSIYTFKENQLRLNALELAADGNIAIPGDDIVFDLSFSAPANDFRQLWSMIPTAYVADYQDIKAAGTFALNGEVKGPFNADRSVYPAFKFDVDVKNGSVQYPGRPIGIDNINANVKVNSPTADLNRMTVNIPAFGINLGGDPFSGNFRLSTPISDPDIDARINGRLDLAKWAQAIPLEGVSDLAGLIIADVSLNNVKQSLLESGNYAGINMSGQTSITDLLYVADGLPRVELSRIQADFSPQYVNIPDFAMQLGKSDLKGRARIDNILAYFSPEKTMTGSATIKSTLFDADEWVPAEADPGMAATTAPAPATVPAPNGADELFDRFDFALDAEVDEIRYGTYNLRGNRVNGSVRPNELRVNNIATTLGKTSLVGQGTVTNAWDYYFKDATLGGQLNLRSDYVDVADFMDDTAVESSSSSGDAATESLAVVPVPERINLAVDLDAKRVKYTDILLDNVSGQLVVADQQVVIENGTTKLLGGFMDFAGAYDTSEPGEPGFRFHYDLKSLGFGPAFKYLNTFQALAPIAEFLSGQFNSDLVVSGKLGPDLYPLLNTIDAQGFLQTVDAGLAKFKPLEKVGQALDIRELRENIDLKGIKGWFKIEDGRVTVEPFNVKLAGIPMRIAGTHGLDMDMNYQIQAAVPRDKISGNIVTGTAIGALDQLAGKANQLGLNIQPGDTLNVGIGLTGRLSNPQTKINLLGAKKSNGQSVGDAVVNTVTDEVNERIDEQKQVAQAAVDSTRQVVDESVTAIKDTVKNAAEQVVSDLKTEAGKQIKGLLTGRDSSKQDSVHTPATPDKVVKETVNDIKKELSKFNPFKKKKTGGR